LDACGEKEEQGVAYLRIPSGKREIVAYVWGNRDKKMAEKLKEKIKEMGISYDLTATDNWGSFLAVF
jgi:IS1 family transposase